MKKIIKTDNAPKPIGPYNQAVIAGDYMFISGQIALNPKNGELITDDINNETTQVMENLKAILSEASLTFDNVVKNLRSNPLIDQIIFKKSDNIVNIVRAPIGFISTEKGIENSELNSMDNNRFVELIKEELNKMNYNSSYTIIKNTALPDKETEFMSLFYNSAKNQIKNPLLFQSRIMGLVSYFRTQNNCKKHKMD